MNTPGQQALNETAGGFDDFSAPGLQISDMGWHRPFGVFLVNRLEGDTDLLHQTLHRVVIKGLVGMDGTTAGQVELKAMQSTHVGIGPGGEKYFNRFAGHGDQCMDSQPVEVAPLAGDVAPISFVLITPCPANTDVIAGANGEAVDDVDRVGVELFEHSTKDLQLGLLNRTFGNCIICITCIY